MVNETGQAGENDGFKVVKEKLRIAIDYHNRQIESMSYDNAPGLVQYATSELVREISDIIIRTPKAQWRQLLLFLFHQ